VQTGHGTANTYTAPPSGPRVLTGEEAIQPVVHAAGVAAHPLCTARYCLPFTENVGGATMPDVVTNSHNSFPVDASNAWILESLVPPVNTAHQASPAWNPTSDWLVEGTTRSLPGTRVDVHVTAAQGRVLVHARVVQCAVWTVTAEVIQYRGALAFTTPVDLPPGEVASQESPEASVVPPRPYQKQQRRDTSESDQS
jgi:hypothetical protein